MFRTRRIKYYTKKINNLSKKAKEAKTLAFVYKHNYYKLSRYTKIHPLYFKEYKGPTKRQIKKIKESPPKPPTEKSFYNLIRRLHKNPTDIDKNYRGWMKMQKKEKKIRDKLKEYQQKLKELQRNSFGSNKTLYRVIRFNAMY